LAPGWPGIPARWTSSAKSGVGTAVSRDSRVWFTLSHGILNEIYYPRVDHACTRDLGFIVTDGQTYFSEEKRDARSETSQVARGVPAYQIRNTAVDGRYRIEKEVLADPWRDVVLQRVRFVPLHGTLTDFRLYALLAPHLSNRGSGNTAWVGDYKGTPMLLAERDSFALALASSVPWLVRSVGFVGVSDGWQELQANKRLIRTYLRAENGNIAVTGEIDLRASDGVFTLALGFGPTAPLPDSILSPNPAVDRAPWLQRMIAFCVRDSRTASHTTSAPLRHLNARAALRKARGAGVTQWGCGTSRSVASMIVAVTMAIPSPRRLGRRVPAIDHNQGTSRP
jgi:hypothetical protein